MKNDTNDHVIHIARRRLAAGIASLPTEFLSNLKWQYAGNIGVGLIGGLYLLYLGRVLGVEEFGLYALCLSAATLVFGLSDMRLQEAMIHFVSRLLSSSEALEAGATAKTIFILDIGVRAIGCAAACAASPAIAFYIVRDSDAAPIICLAALGLFVGKAGYNPALGILRLTDRFDLSAKLQIADWSLRFAATVIVFAFFHGTVLHVLTIAAVIGGLFNVAIISAAAHAWRYKIDSAIIGIPDGLLSRIGRMRRFVLPSHGINLLDLVIRDLDSVIVGLFASVAAVGLYRMVKSVAQLTWRAADPIFLVLMPILSRFLHAADREGMRAFLRRLTILSTAMAVALFLGANLFVPVIIWTLLPDFSPIVRVLPLMTWWVLIALPLIWTHPLATATGRPDLQLKASLLGNSLGAILLVTLVPRFSITGAAIGWSVGLAATFLLTALLLKRRHLL